MTPLYQELHRWAATPFVWGQMDCILSICDWIHQVRGVDPAVEVRGTYTDLGSCHRETGFFRDPIGVVDRYFGAVGIEQTDTLVAGDVGLIMATDPDGRALPCGALWMGSAWGCKGPVGTTTLNARGTQVLARWAVGYVA